MFCDDPTQGFESEGTLKRFRRFTAHKCHDILPSGMQKIILSTILLAVSFLMQAQAQLTVHGDSLITLGKNNIHLSKQGFPEQIDNLLAENIHFHFTRQSDGKDIRLTPGGPQFTRQKTNRTEWNATSTSNELQMEVNASLKADGHLTYKVKITALQDLDLKDITMHIPFQPGKAKFIKGLGLPYGPRPDSNFHWSWPPGRKGPAGAWIGMPDNGLRYSLERGPWNNEGKGGIIIGIKGKSMLVNNYSGPLHMQKGKSLQYDFDLQITEGDLQITGSDK